MSSSPFLFSAAIGGGYPVLAGGSRLDPMDQCGHYARWEADFELVRELGLPALRYGPAWYRVHLAPGEYDWDVCDEPMRRLGALGIEVIAVLCHHGVPGWLGGFTDAALPHHFAEYARAFARRYPWVRHYAPVIEMFAAARRSALDGQWNECQASEGAFVRAVGNLAMAHELAVDAILEERPDAKIVHSEAAEHFHAAGRRATRAAERWNALRFLPLDLTLGREPAPGMAALLSEHGLSATDLSYLRARRAAGGRWMGLTYHASHEHRVASSGRLTVARRAWGLRRVALEYDQRYRLPLLHLGTSRERRLAPAWLRSQWEDVLALRRAGVPVVGFTWDTLADHAAGAGLVDPERRLRPAGEAYRDLVSRWTRVLAAPAEQHESATA